MNNDFDKIEQQLGDRGREPEIPEFIIERDENAPLSSPHVIHESKRKKWLRRMLKALAVAVIAAMTIVAFKTWEHYYDIGVPVSTSPKENIKKLKGPAKQEKAGVICISDSILGVDLDFFAIHGLRANIEFEEPDTADTSVFLYCRSADHTADSIYLGSLVVNGQDMRNDPSRLGYMAMVDNQMVIGISRFETVKNFAMENGGSFFRQFVLVSDGVIPQQFFLHGKVERRAIGRMRDTLYYIATRNKETLWDFADALREYGFIDAIYITGGAGYSYYRSTNGKRHDIGDIKNYPNKKWKGVIPWLVFRKMK